MLRVGIIGCGRIMEEGHAPAFLKLRDRVEVVALADPSPHRRELVGDMLGVPACGRFADYADMLTNAEVDFVDLALPHFLHEEITIACAEAGVNILSEKPLSTSVASAKRMLAAVDKAGVTLGVLHNYKWQPRYRQAQAWIDEGRIGKPFFVRSEHLGGGHYKGASGYDPDWRAKAARAGGGALLDNGYHYIYLAESWMQSPVQEAYGKVGTYVQQQDVDDLAAVLLTHENGGISSVQFSWAVKATGQAVGEVHGTRGSISFTRAAPVSLFQNDENQWTDAELAPDSGFTGLISEYVAALEAGGQPPVTGQDALHNLAIVMAAYASAERDEPVRIADILEGS